MRTVLTLLVALIALPAVADDSFSLGLAEMDFSAAQPETASAALRAMVAGDEATERAEVLAFQAALKPKDPTERTLALWNSEMGRLHYEFAVAHSMLGREGLVNGGRMAGIGLGTVAVGDGNPNGALGLVLGRQKWVEMNANEKFRAGVEASLLLGIVYALATMAD